MIDLGLTKIALIGVVALVVIGPEKLPRVARMAGTLFGRAQRYINQVKSEVSREMEIDEFRRMQKEVEEAAATAGRSVRESADEMHSELGDVLYQSSHSSHGTIHGGADATIHGVAAAKSKAFRKKCVARNTAVPAWYKHRSGQRVRVISAAARVARFRPGGSKSASSFAASFFH
ncbi:MAG: Sec-independent protein translocase protein TatB [Pseudomonadota bacterium]